MILINDFVYTLAKFPNLGHTKPLRLKDLVRKAFKGGNFLFYIDPKIPKFLIVKFSQNLIINTYHLFAIPHNSKISFFQIKNL